MVDLPNEICRLVGGGLVLRRGRVARDVSVGEDCVGIVAL